MIPKVIFIEFKGQNDQEFSGHITSRSLFVDSNMLSSRAHPVDLGRIAQQLTPEHKKIFYPFFLNP